MLYRLRIHFYQVIMNHHLTMKKNIFKLESKYIMPTYARPSMVLDQGKGVYVFDTKGRKYLDFIGGIATCSIGHANKAVIKVINQQTKKLLNVTNLYYTEPQVKLAQKLCKLTGFNAKVFFSNSGAEAVEADFKLARKKTCDSLIRVSVGLEATEDLIEDIDQALNA